MLDSFNEEKQYLINFDWNGNSHKESIKNKYNKISK